MSQKTYTLKQQRLIVAVKQLLNYTTILFFLSISAFSYAENKSNQAIDLLCSEIGSTLGSVSIKDCKAQNLSDSGERTTYDRPLAYKIYPPLEGKQEQGKILLMGGIHGDEYSAISIMFRWMETLNKHHSGLFHWQVIPLLNPDGLLNQARATRQNGAGVDLNRNFPSQDWDALAQAYWENRTYKNPRRYPGARANSEPETQWFVDIIDQFQPDVIIAVHAPHRLVDYDGPQNAPNRLGQLRLRQLGTYPGSLGNYAGVDLNIPVVTVELASAGSMPSRKEISTMWVDLVRWLVREVPKRKQASTD